MLPERMDEGSRTMPVCWTKMDVAVRVHRREVAQSTKERGTGPRPGVGLAVEHHGEATGRTSVPESHNSRTLLDPCAAAGNLLEVRLTLRVKGLGSPSRQLPAFVAEARLVIWMGDRGRLLTLHGAVALRQRRMGCPPGWCKRVLRREGPRKTAGGLVEICFVLRIRGLDLGSTSR